MRVADNCRRDYEAGFAMAEMAREARDGAGHSRTMVRQAARAVVTHPRYRERWRLMKTTFWGAL